MFWTTSWNFAKFWNILHRFKNIFILGRTDAGHGPKSPFTKGQHNNHTTTSAFRPLSQGQHSRSPVLMFLRPTFGIFVFETFHANPTGWNSRLGFVLKYPADLAFVFVNVWATSVLAFTHFWWPFRPQGLLSLAISLTLTWKVYVVSCEYSWYHANIQAFLVISLKNLRGHTSQLSLRSCEVKIHYSWQESIR